MRQELSTNETYSGAEAVRGLRGDSAPASPLDVLRRTMESDVVPRLVEAYRLAARTRDSMDPAHAPSPDHVEGLVNHLLGEDQPASADFVHAMRALGASSESLYLDLLTPAARRLGVMWEEDTCDFSEVTIGLFRLQMILRDMAPAFVGINCVGHAAGGDTAAPRARAPRALLVQTPGEQHGLGISMVAQFFARDGWNVCSDPVATRADLLDRVRHNHFALIGISVGCSERIEPLADDIRAIRRVSRNRKISIMVGGSPFVEHPQLADLVGADATASDAREAVRCARLLIAAPAHAR